MNYFQTFRDAAILLALLIIPFFFLSAHLKDPSKVSWLDSALIQVSAPIQYVAGVSADAVTGVFEDYVFLVDVHRDNDHLRAENDRLQREMRALRARAARVDQLETLLGLRDRASSRTLTGRVIARDVSPSFRVIRLLLDQGERDGVRAGQPVVSNQGLVGQVRRLSGRFADVLLTVDTESRVDVIVGQSGARGRLEGLGEEERYRALIQFDRPEDEVEIGDEVYTSGLGKKFPASILIGYITKINEQEFGLHQEGEVTPSVDFSRLNEVLILTSEPKEAGRL